jgi:hypothetical protein
MLRQLSTDSVSSINSLSSACSQSSSAHAPDNSIASTSKKKKKGWVSVMLYHFYLATHMRQLHIHSVLCSGRPVFFSMNETDPLCTRTEFSILHYFSKFTDFIGVNSVHSLYILVLQG